MLHTITGKHSSSRENVKMKNLQALILGFLYEVKKFFIQKSNSLSLSVHFSRLFSFSDETCCRILIKFGTERLYNIFYQI